MFDTRGILPASVLVLAGMVVTNVAAASQSCQGSYAATILHPLPAQIVVGLDIHDRSPRNLRLAERFLAGVRDAGIAAGAQPNVLLHVSTSRLDAASSRSSGVELSYSGLYGLQGGGQPRLPALPTAGVTAQPPPPAQPDLFVRVDATEGEATRIAWVASVQCRMVGSDEGQLAQDLGHVIGSALGQRIDRRAF